MKKKIFMLGLCSLMLCGCGKIPTLSNGEEAVVTFKDNEGISANDFYQQIKDTYGLQTLINMIDKYVYETEFPDKISEATEQAEAQVKSLKANYDSDEDFESVLSYNGFRDEEAYKDYVYISYLQNMGIEEYAQSLVTEDELKKYYESNIYPDMNISHILITADVASDATDEEKESAEKTAKETAQKVIDELNKAKKNNEDITAKFSELAATYSVDTSTKDNGGDLGSINIGSLGTKYDELVKTASKLEDGEYSTEVITTELGYHVILKTKTGEKIAYEDAIEDMTESIANDNLTNNSSLITDAIQHYRKKYELDIIDSEMDKQYSNYMNKLINTYKSSE